MKILPLLSVIFLLISCKQTNTELSTSNSEGPINKSAQKLSNPEVAAIVNAHGLKNWDQVENIAFTFNVDRAGKNVAKRSWIWNPKTNDVTMMTATDTVIYNRSNIDSTSLKADQGFINDKFWLLAPYQMAWDEGTTITTEESATAPLSRKQMKKITLTYTGDGGYTPGDAYDFYYNTPDTIEEWVFRKGNASEPTMTTTFEGYEEQNGLRIATDHRDKEGNFRLYFTELRITKLLNEH